MLQAVQGQKVVILEVAATETLQINIPKAGERDFQEVGKNLMNEAETIVFRKGLQTLILPNDHLEARNSNLTGKTDFKINLPVKAFVNVALALHNPELIGKIDFIVVIDLLL